LDQPTTKPATPYEALGGSAVIERIVARFYEQMDNDPELVKKIHAEDLGPKSADSANARPAGKTGSRQCVMSLHRAFPISAEVGEQWATDDARSPNRR
jgi:hemoglobin